MNNFSSINIIENTQKSVPNKNSPSKIQKINELESDFSINLKKQITFTMIRNYSSKKDLWDNELSVGEINKLNNLIQKKQNKKYFDKQEEYELNQLQEIGLLKALKYNNIKLLTNTKTKQMNKPSDIPTNLDGFLADKANSWVQEGFITQKEYDDLLSLQLNQQNNFNDDQIIIIIKNLKERNILEAIQLDDPYLVKKERYKVSDSNTSNNSYDYQDEEQFNQESNEEIQQLPNDNYDDEANYDEIEQVDELIDDYENYN